jgi:hypothetical protein
MADSVDSAKLDLGEGLNGTASLHERRDAMQFRHDAEFADGAAENRVMTDNVPENIMDNKPFVNILPFGMCQSPSNPAVAAARPRLSVC